MLLCLGFWSQLLLSVQHQIWGCGDMGWGAHLSCLPRVRSEDIDQLFGRLASWIARHHRLENLDQFVQCIQRFLNTLEGHPWPSQQHRLAFPLTAMHDWMAWLEGCGMTLKGHTWPQCPSSLLLPLQRELRGCPCRSGRTSALLGGRGNSSERHSSVCEAVDGI